MKRMLALGLAMIAILALLLALAATFPAAPPEGFGRVSFRGQSGEATLLVEVADTPQEQMTGLMNREELPPGEGMLFVFGEDSGRSFWMKNTLIPLDMIFINSSLDIVSIQRDVPPCTESPCPVYRSGLPAMYVVEANAGFSEENGIRPGQKVSINPGVRTEAL